GEVAAGGVADMTATLRSGTSAGRGPREPVDRTAGREGSCERVGASGQEAAAVAVDEVEEDEPEEEESVDDEDEEEEVEEDAPSEEDEDVDPAPLGLLLDPESVL